MAQGNEVTVLVKVGVRVGVTGCGVAVGTKVSVVVTVGVALGVMVALGVGVAVGDGQLTCVTAWSVCQL